MTQQISGINHRLKLSDEFLQDTNKTQPKFSMIGKTVYLRTYARRIHDGSRERRENWGEIAKRVVEYSFDLHKGDITESIEREAERLYNVIYNLRGFPAGRTLWVGGTEFVDVNNPKGSALANFNCYYTDVNCPEDIYEISYLLMSGSGVGFSANRDAAENMQRHAPMTIVHPEVMFEDYHYSGVPAVNTYAADVLDHNFYLYDGVTLTLDVGDSREAWGMFYRDFVTAYATGDIQHLLSAIENDVAGKNHKRRIHYLDTNLFEGRTHIQNIRVVVDRVRPVGTPLKTFGGTASGPEPLIDFAKDFQRLILTDGIYRWTDTLVNDLINMVGRSTVSGGTRRSALISLGDAESKEFAEMKTGEWYNTHPWRNQSNISSVFNERPQRSVLLERLNQALRSYPEKGIYAAGEPGLFNFETARKRRHDVKGFNPCGEISMRNKGLCNLVEKNMVAALFYDGKAYKLDSAELYSSLYVLVRHNLRITNVDLSREMPEWDKVQKEDRLLGVALSGLMDFKNALGWDNKQLGELLSELRAYVRKVAFDYADEMGIPRPLLVTTIKPSGSISLIPGVSPGAHPAIAPYYWRRIRIGKNDGVGRALAFLGVPHEADMYNVRSKAKSRGIDASTWGPKDEQSYELADTLVYSFPSKSNANKTANDYTAIEQLEFYKLTMDHWTDHNTSITIYVEEHEIEEIADWLYENWDSYIGISFLPKTKTVYEQAPYEAISEDQYREALAAFPDLSDLEEYVANIEFSGISMTDIMEMCEGGHCPAR